MTIAEAITKATANLSHCGIDEPRLGAEILLMHALQVSRAHLYARLKDELTTNEYETYSELVQLRLSGESVWYIIGHREFFGLDFIVDPRVLVPRPETEMLVEKALGIVRSRPSAPGESPTLADIGSGCGAIAISLAVHLPEAKIYASDVSERAFEVAAINRRKHQTGHRVILLRGDMLTPLPEPVDIILANLPYLSEIDLTAMGAETLMPEPLVALAGGQEGLDKIRQLLQESPTKLKPNGSLLMEIGYRQRPAVMDLVRTAFPQAKVDLCKDLAGLDRMVSIET